MGQNLSKVQLPVGVPERMRQHCGRHAEPNHYLPRLEAMQSILDVVSLGATHRAEGYDPTVVDGDHCLKKRYVSPREGVG